MPELPEVETIRRDLVRLVVGRAVVAVDVGWPGSLKDVGPDFTARLIGARFSGFARRAKILIAELDSGDRLLVHLKMSGRLTVVPAGTPPDKHTRVTFELDSREELRFIDMRKFGYIKLVPVGAPAVLPELDRLGPEPLAPDFTAADWLDLVAAKGNSKRNVKAVLLDQTFIAGLGNIYVDEILHAAGIHPERPFADVSADEAARIYPEMRRILLDAIVGRGTTFDLYVDGEGRRGEYLERLAVYGRQGKSCRRCGSVIEKIRVAGRGTHFCPECQGG